jgi:hypothetical protein
VDIVDVLLRDLASVCEYRISVLRESCLCVCV